MKKGKILKEEISRIHQLIGVNPNVNIDLRLDESLLIVESFVGVLTDAAKLIDNLKNSGKKISTTLDNLMDDFAKAADESEKLLALGKIMDESEDFYKKLFPKIKKLNETQLNALRKAATEALKNGEDPDNVKRVLKLQIDKIFKDIPSTKLKKDLVYEYNSIVDSYKPNQFDNVEIPSGVKSKISNWVSTSFPNVDSVLTLVRNYFSNYERLLNAYKRNHDIAAKLLLEGRGDDAIPYIKKMADLLAATRNLKKTPKTVWEGLDSQGKKGWKDEIIPEIQYKLKYAKTGEPWEGMMEAIAESNGSIKKYFDETLTVYNELFDIFRKGKRFGGLKRIGNFLAYGDPRTVQEIAIRLQKSGLPAYAWRRVFAYLVIFPMMITLFKLLGNLALEGAELVASPFTDKENPLGSDWADDQNWKWEVFDTFIKTIPTSIIGFIDMTYVDEIWNTMDGYIGPGFKESDEFKVQSKIEQKYLDWKEGLPEEEQAKIDEVIKTEGLEDSTESSTETSTETQTTEEQPLTYDPLFKNLFSKYPCLKTQFKNGDIKKLSDTKLKIMGNGSEWTVIIGSDGNASYTEKNGVSINPVPVQCG